MSDEYPLTNYQWDLPKVPEDEDGFTLSFPITATEQYKKFFDEFGFVVVNDILSPSENDASIKEIWNLVENKSSSDEPLHLSIAEEFFLKASELEKHGKPMEAVEFYSRAFTLMPQLEDDDVAQAVMKKRPSKVDRNDPSTWVDENWTTSQTHGFLGSFVADGQAAFANRQNPRLYEVFQNIIGQKDLWVAIDRYGIMRPTRNVPDGPIAQVDARSSVALTPDEIDQTGIKLQDHPEWKSASTWTHWDLNPWKWILEKEDGMPYYFDDWMSEYNGTKNDGIVKLQGLVSFVDSRKGDGGFSTVPGFHQHLEKWVDMTKDTDHRRMAENRYSLVKVAAEDSLHKFLYNVSMRAGSLLIWRGEQAHCNYPNDSDRFRMNQYIKMFPAQWDGPRFQLRCQEMSKILGNFVPTELGLKLFGLKNWTEE
eukprot:TRINITY_DN5760_c0_g2_i1.p1 TRINITY_DN5760_c0_g2~~TRINITY_DN5760_c0_g2_i1.p1  ORF type:complete len:424 (-),score=122.18 TRINITY_DN5760_c0_g2_i1:99-1370(-)